MIVPSTTNPMFDTTAAAAAGSLRVAREPTIVSGKLSRSRLHGSFKVSVSIDDAPPVHRPNHGHIGVPRPAGLSGRKLSKPVMVRHGHSNSCENVDLNV